MPKISMYFTEQELACKGDACCGHSCPMDQFLLVALDILRNTIGKPITPSSGFRCQIHNRNIGRKPTSQHCLGRAADLQTPEGLTVDVFAAVAETIPTFTGIGIYTWGIHVDNRPGPHVRIDNR